MSRRFALAVLALSLLLPLASSSAGFAAELQKLEIASRNGSHPFTVELAVTPQERERGLMFRRALPQDRGMLFDFSPEQQVSMWMQNTYIPLDMVFIRADGTIARIAENTEPMSTRLIPSGEPVRAVLELAGGTAKKLGIAPGDKVIYPLFKTR